MQDLIDKFGLERTLQTIFPNLDGIVFGEVIYDQTLNQTSPIKYLTQDIDDNWYFGQGNMAMIFRTVKSTAKTKILNSLLKANNLKKTEVFKNDINTDISFWKGNGFKIELAKINKQIVIIVTNEEAFSQQALAMTDTDLASVIESPKWIRGIDKVFDGTSTLEENRNLSNFKNTPLFFDDENGQYIIIPVSTYGIGKKFIDLILSNNGGKNNFEFIDNEKTKGWDYFHRGKIFSIGYLPKQSCVRINSFAQSQESTDGTKLERGIHPLSDKINTLIEGLNTPIYNPGEGGVPDGRFYAVSNKANVIVSFYTDLNKAKDKYDQIVLNHNPGDKTLKIKNKSIKEFFEKNPEELFQFNVDGKFLMQLSKGNAHYRINLYPSGGFLNDWNFDDKTKINEKNHSESSASKSIRISEKTSSETNSKPSYDKRQQRFFNQSIKPKIKNKKRDKSFLNSKNLISKTKKINLPYLKKILKFLILLLLLLFVYKACFYDECSGNAVCYYLKAQEAEKGADFENAFIFYKKAIRVDKKYVDAYNSRGLLYQKLEKHDKAIRDFSKIIDIDNANWWAFHNRANSYTAQGDKNYSIEFRKAMKDYDKSIDLNSSNDNGVSYYNRGLLKEKIEKEACDDFVYSCDREYLAGCERYNSICYPKNGSYVLFNEFGRGVFANNGLAKIRLDNSRGDKDLVVVIRKYIGSTTDGPRIRAQFVRKGDIVTMENIPNGTYYTQDYYGNYWIKNLNPQNRFLRSYNFYDFKSSPVYVYNRTLEYTYNVSGGDQGDSISEDEFFN